MQQTTPRSISLSIHLFIAIVLGFMPLVRSTHTYLRTYVNTCIPPSVHPCIHPSIHPFRRVLARVCMHIQEQQRPRDRLTKRKRPGAKHTQKHKLWCDMIVRTTTNDDENDDDMDADADADNDDDGHQHHNHVSPPQRLLLPPPPPTPPPPPRTPSQKSLQGHRLHWHFKEA